MSFGFQCTTGSAVNKVIQQMLVVAFELTGVARSVRMGGQQCFWVIFNCFDIIIDCTGGSRTSARGHPNFPKIVFLSTKFLDEVLFFGLFPLFNILGPLSIREGHVMLPFGSMGEISIILTFPLLFVNTTIYIAPSVASYF